MKTYEMYDTKSTGKTNYYTNKLRQTSNSLHNYNNDSFNVVNPNSPTFISTKSLQFFDPQTQLTEKEKNDNNRVGMNNEVQKANEMIELLRNQNDSLVSQRDLAVSQMKKIKEGESKYKENIERAEQRIYQLENENMKLKNELERLNEELFNKEKLIEQLKVENERIKNDLGNEIIDLRNKLDNERKTYEKKKKEFIHANLALNDKIQELSKSLDEEKSKNDQLVVDNMNEIKMDEITKKVLDYLFNYYNNTKQIVDPKSKRELLNEAIELNGPNELQIKLSKLEEAIRTLYDCYKLKFGKCFACDIACCTSHNDRIKFFK